MAKAMKGYLTMKKRKTWHETELEKRKVKMDKIKTGLAEVSEKLKLNKKVTK